MGDRKWNEGSGRGLGPIEGIPNRAPLDVILYRLAIGLGAAIFLLGFWLWVFNWIFGQ